MFDQFNVYILNVLYVYGYTKHDPPIRLELYYHTKYYTHVPSNTWYAHTEYAKIHTNVSSVVWIFVVIEPHKILPIIVCI